MLEELLSIMPSMVCLFWFILNPFILKKDHSYYIFQTFLAVLFIATVSHVGLTLSNGRVMLYFFLAKQFFAPIVIPLLLIFILALQTSRPFNPRLLIWLLIPALLLFAEIIVIRLIETDNYMSLIDRISDISNPVTNRAEKILQFCSSLLFYGIMITENITFLVLAIFIAPKENYDMRLLGATLTAMIYSLKEICTILSDDHNVWICSAGILLFALSLFLLCYSSLFQDRKYVTWDAVWCGLDVSPRPQATPMQEWGNANMERIRVSAIKQTEKPDTDISSSITESESDDTDMDPDSQAYEKILRNKLEDLMVKEQLFLQHGIRITDIASRLGTNRTYISKIVNNTYNKNFSDYINTLRIDYAQQYLMQNPDARQSDVASICGFPNASAFNNTFKKMKGVTPKIWLATRQQ